MYGGALDQGGMLSVIIRHAAKTRLPGLMTGVPHPRLRVPSACVYVEGRWTARGANGEKKTVDIHR